MTQAKTDADRVFDLVRANPGLTEGCYRWIMAGGRVVNGRRVGEVSHLVPQVEAKVAKVQQRLHDLKAKGLVYQDVPAYETDSIGLGFWPMGTKARKQAPSRPPPDGRHHAVPSSNPVVARKVISGLKEKLS